MGIWLRIANMTIWFMIITTFHFPSSYKTLFIGNKKYI